MQHKVQFLIDPLTQKVQEISKEKARLNPYVLASYIVGRINIEYPCDSMPGQGQGLRLIFPIDAKDPIFKKHEFIKKIGSFIRQKLSNQPNINIVSLKLGDHECLKSGYTIDSQMQPVYSVEPKTNTQVIPNWLTGFDEQIEANKASVFPAVCDLTLDEQIKALQKCNHVTRIESKLKSWQNSLSCMLLEKDPDFDEFLLKTQNLVRTLNPPYTNKSEITSQLEEFEKCVERSRLRHTICNGLAKGFPVVVFCTALVLVLPFILLTVAPPLIPVFAVVAGLLAGLSAFLAPDAMDLLFPNAFNSITSRLMPAIEGLSWPSKQKLTSLGKFLGLLPSGESDASLFATEVTNYLKSVNPSELSNPQATVTDYTPIYPQILDGSKQEQVPLPPPPPYSLCVSNPYYSSPFYNATPSAPLPTYVHRQLDDTTMQPVYMQNGSTTNDQ